MSKPTLHFRTEGVPVKLCRRRFALDVQTYAGFSMPRFGMALTSATRPPRAAQPPVARPTRQHKVPSANGRAPTTTWLARSVENNRPWSPIWWGIEQRWKSQHEHFLLIACLNSRCLLLL